MTNKFSIQIMKTKILLPIALLLIILSSCSKGKSAGTIKDIDGNEYNTVTIGTQTWMSENLKTRHYQNGDLIETTNPALKNISVEKEPKYQWTYKGDDDNCKTYGLLYTWYAATDSRNIAPKGWHVATDDDWSTLENYLISHGYNFDETSTENKIAKSLAATSLWNSCQVDGGIGCNTSKNNTSGFNAISSGIRYDDGTFNNMNLMSYFWTSTDSKSKSAYSRDLSFSSYELSRRKTIKSWGLSIRCVKN